MKYLSIISILCVSTILVGTSSKKQAMDPVPKNPLILRKIQFLLYTDKDFSNNNTNITFTLTIQRPTSQVVWDSVLPVMKIKDIPDSAHKLVIEKQVSSNDNSLLKVGFLYSIENIGNSWHFDQSNPGETFTTVDFNFQ